MKNEEMNYDDLIGSMKSREITKKQHDTIRAARKASFEKRLDKDKIEDILVGFQVYLKEVNELIDGYKCVDIMGTQDHIEKLFSDSDKLIPLTKEQFINKIKTDDEFANNFLFKK